MSDDLYSSLSWLPRPPDDFRQRCRRVLESPDDDRVSSLRFLAGHALNDNQLQRLAATIDALRARGHDLAPLTPFRLGVLGNGTLDHVVPALVATAVRHGVALECVQADFAQTVQEALSRDSSINRANPDAVLLALDYRGLPLQPGLHDAAAASAMVENSTEFLRTLRSGFRDHGRALSIVQTLAPLPETVFGNFDRVAAGSLRSLTAAFNAALVRSLGDTPDIVLDVAAIAETVGLSHWHSATQWNLAKFPFASEFVPLYADHVGRVLGALRGKSRKCLVLDLDNTLWGGVIGDDGLEGLVIGQGDATGEAYLDVQRQALALRDRGVVLAVSSKNTDHVARSAFVHHPEMLLRENHIAVFQANWEDKATNIAAIAAELALGTDAVVFMDDNPAERALVRTLLPDVAVPELPDNPALYARTLAAAGYFETIAFSDEDRTRAEMYQQNARRVALQGQAGGIEGYLASLKMEIVFRPFDALGRSRIAQLVNKSNQFNLTTRRYTEAAIAELELDPSRFTLQVRLIDLFGDNGMISVVVCRPRSADTWEIDTWLMSCRVLGRHVEQMVLREIIHHARERGIRTLVGVYLPTAKNGMVRDHYAKLGFRQTSADGSEAAEWELGTDAEIALAPMRVDRDGFSLVPV
ncbi:MAG: HAD-IIIC family phosphatase [Candidatus Eremiobacteraeota bacterium]|nr:HAD-IIIC family phosphatase [Candidatus Eremiobacteraeota bacterium]